jgi:hypothetical protein
MVWAFIEEKIFFLTPETEPRIFDRVSYSLFTRTAFKNALTLVECQCRTICTGIIGKIFVACDAFRSSSYGYGMSQLPRNVLVSVPMLLLWEKEQRSVFTKPRTKLGNSKIMNSYEIFYFNERLYGHLHTVVISFRDSVTDRRTDVGNWLC